MTTTPHLISPEEIMAHLDHELAPAQDAIIAEHILTCATCAALANDFRSLSANLNSWTVPPLPAHVQRKIFGAAHVVRPTLRPRRRWLTWVIAAPATTVLLLAAYITTQSQKPSLYQKNKAIALVPPSDRYEAGTMDAPAPPQAFESRTSADQAGAVASVTMAVPAPPMIARTAALTVQVKSVTGARSTLERILSRHHGYYAEMNISGADSSSPVLTSSLRIPAAELPSAIDDLKNLGKVLSESQSDEEVGKQHADLDARLKTSRETEDRYRAILQQRTGSVADILEVEQAIARTRGEIESMEAEQQSLEHRVTFATVQLNISQPYTPAVDSSDPVGLHNRNSLIAGYQNAVGTLLGLLYFLEEYGPPILIWIALLGVPAYLLHRRYRRRNPSL